MNSTLHNVYQLDGPPPRENRGGDFDKTAVSREILDFINRKNYDERVHSAVGMGVGRVELVVNELLTYS